MKRHISQTFTRIARNNIFWIIFEICNQQHTNTLNALLFLHRTLIFYERFLFKESGHLNKNLFVKNLVNVGNLRYLFVIGWFRNVIICCYLYLI